jgi:hypothetical protein
VADATVILRKGEKRNLFGTLTANSTLTLASATFTLYDSNHAVVSGFSGQAATLTIAGPALTVKASYALDTSAAAIVAGDYEAWFVLTDANGLVYEVWIDVTVLSVPE